MHICSDEIIAFTTALATALPFLPRVRAFLKRCFQRVQKAIV